METVAMNQSNQRAHPPLAALGKLTLTALVGIALVMFYLQTVVFGEFDPVGAMMGVLPLVFAGLVATGWRWTPALGALTGGALLAIIGPELHHIFASPSDGMFAPVVVLLALILIAAGAGIGATIQNYRRPAVERLAPRGLSTSLAALTGLCLGAILVAAIPQTSASAGISAEVMAQLPAVVVHNFAFEQKEIRAKVGETVILRLENHDSATHSFDIDELNVHAPILPNQTSVALFKATQLGTYTFYCAPHYDKARGEGMKGTLIVEP